MDDDIAAVMELIASSAVTDAALVAE
jgi:hypothetical protein